MDGFGKSFDYDVAVLGGGSAGFAAARTSADAGLRTVVIEGGRDVGGLCILRGCMPSKALLYATEVLHLARKAGAWGLDVGSAGFDIREVMARKQRLIDEFADERRKQLEAGGFAFIRANAVFRDQHTLELSPVRNGRQPEILRAAYFIIATGSVVSPSPLPELSDAGYITSDDALELKRLPKSLIVLGGGPTACELAQFFARLDVNVTMIQRSGHVLKQFDHDIATVIETVLRRDGVRLFTDTDLEDASRGAGQKTVTFKWKGATTRVSAEEILFCLGRTPDTASLGLENTGIGTDDGRIPTNEHMQTSVPHIYAVGDCTGPHQIVHLAVMQGQIAAHHVAGHGGLEAIDHRLLMHVVFTDPQLAFVGITENEARAREIPYLAASHPFSDHGKSLIMEARDGFVKLLADPKSGEIIGGTCAGPLGGELIHEITAAMMKHMTAGELADMPHYHPTLAEIWTYPAGKLADSLPAACPDRRRWIPCRPP